MKASAVPWRRWLITDKGDQDVRRLIDGVSVGKPPHYSRRSPGDPQFTRNGQNLVFLTKDARAAWITFRPTPGKAERMDRLLAWECALFRNESAVLSSELVREAHLLTLALWGAPPQDGLITFIRPEAVESEIPGYCYRRAGWRRRGAASDGKPLLRAPAVEGEIPSWREWSWSGDRGGILRRRLADVVQARLL